MQKFFFKESPKKGSTCAHESYCNGRLASFHTSAQSEQMTQFIRQTLGGGSSTNSDYWIGLRKHCKGWGSIVPSYQLINTGETVRWSLFKTAPLLGKIFHPIHMKTGLRASLIMKMTKTVSEHMSYQMNRPLVRMANSLGMMNIVRIMQNLFVNNTWKIIINQQINGCPQENHQQLVAKRDGKSMEADAMHFLVIKIVTQTIEQR